MNKMKLSGIVLVGTCLIGCSSSEESDVTLPVDNPPVANLQTSVKQPALLSMQFLSIMNSSIISQDIMGEIINDSLVEVRLPNIVENKELAPQFVFVGDSITLDGKIYLGGGTFDFSKPITVTVYSDSIFKNYVVNVHGYTGLPILWIETEGRKDITSKDIYINAKLKLVEDVVTRGAGDVIETDVQIKGRGNSSWSISPKKSYRLKFNKKISLLGEPADKAWVLNANYFDKTMIRNQTAFYMGKISNLEYTPKFHFVEMFLNGQYHGTYMLGDKLKIAKHRVNVGDDGFLLEVDERAEEENGTYFKTDTLPQPVNIKDPELSFNDLNYNFIKDYVRKAEYILFSENFRDAKTGWQKYMDIVSFVDWYIINEIVRNGDGVFFTSTYMNLKRGDKLRMGPLWDFDTSFGNHTNPDVYPPTGFYIRNTPWMKRLFEDNAFVREVKKRFDYFYNRRNDIYRNMNEDAAYLKYTVIENNNRWHTLYEKTTFNYEVWGCYDNEVALLKNWLEERFQWLKNEFDKM